MFGEIIYSNENITLLLLNSDVMLLVKKPGYTIEEFQMILREQPRIKITEFAALKNALNGFENRTIAVGVLRNEIELMVSKDRLQAFAKIYASEEEIEEKGKSYFLDQILELAKKEGIVYGLEWENIVERITNNVPIKIASGSLPENGKEALIKMYELKSMKPQISEDGSVNYYEMDLLNKVQKDEWLGERIEPTEGIPGRTVYGEIIPAIQGVQKPLNYDTKSVYEQYDPKAGVTRLLSKQPGVVSYSVNKVISVSKCLTLPKDVSYETGSINFDGSVEIKGTVEDLFSVKASQDIQILGDLGIGAVDTIESDYGNIYIRGGIAGRDRAKIICKGNLYTKFASNCIIECSGTVNIGFYAINCRIKAKDVVFESKNSRIVGGQVEALVRVEVGILGNPMGTRSNVYVQGFKRSELKKQYDFLENAIKKVKEKIGNINKKLTVYSAAQQLNSENSKIYRLLLEENEKYNHSLKILLEEKNKCITYFKIRGEGEIFARKSVYSNVLIQIREEKILNSEPILHPVVYYFADNALKSI